MEKKLKYLSMLLLTLTTVSAGAMLSFANASADTTGSKPISVTVPGACLFSSDTSYSTTLSLVGGTYATTESDSTKVASSISCSGTTGFTIKAIGFSPDSTSAGAGVEGNTAMYGTAGTIPTGTSGSSSYWAMKVTSATSNTSYTIMNSYGDYNVVPGSYTGIVSFAGAQSGTVDGSFRTDYKVSVAASQAVGSYDGAVKYIIATGV